MAAKTKRRATNLSDRDRQSLESEVEAHEARINETVFALYGVEGLPGYVACAIGGCSSV